MIEGLNFSHMTAQMHADEYAEDLEFFLAQYPDDLVQGLKVDHLAYKGWNREWYQAFLASVSQKATDVSNPYRLDDRDLVTVTLKDPLDLGRFGKTSTLEVMEVRPEKARHGATVPSKITLDHIELTGVPLAEMQRRMAYYRVEHTPYANPHHSALVVPFGSLPGRELKITDQILADITQVQADNVSSA